MTTPPAAGTGELNWAKNLRYSAQRVLTPTSLDQLREAVAQAERLKALGSRHSFNTVADTPGDLVDLAGMPRHFSIDEASRTVTVNAAMRCGELAARLQASGWAIATMASLPHISVAGTVATGTHGSGDTIPPLSGLVSGIELVTADGELRSYRRGDLDFDGTVVNLGSLGVVTSVTFDIVPSFEVRQDVYEPVPLESILENFQTITSSAYSVSLFTRWDDDVRVWLKSTSTPPEDFFGVAALTYDVGLVEGPPERTTDQAGLWGSWDTRLPHFKLEFTPSNGDELQSEYLIPRPQAVEAITRIRRLGPRLDPHLFVTEIRTMAEDRQWLSPAYGDDHIGIHFTWRQHMDEVAALLPVIEDELLPLGARPHWGKLFHVGDVSGLYPRVSDFHTLRESLDPTGVFGSEFLTTHLPTA
ncbi:FAD-binding protein [Nesterenkonia alba]|uniref:FAD-binding protein n=1 Tax=Nesterenkonia alba TaxID=515814 RepID=UPI0003B6B9AC|nr:FAD-binding protein [Nesterenkonia alba]